MDLPSHLLAYIDPTGGLPPSSWGPVLATLLAALGAGWAAVRYAGQSAVEFLRRRRRWVVLAALIGALGVTMRFGWFSRSHATAGPRVLVLAFDGLDSALPARPLLRLTAQRRAVEGEAGVVDVLGQEARVSA